MTKTILLVDDELDIREVLAVSLRDMGYDIIQACTGNEALAVFKKEKPPIVLTDIKMPGMDGIELLQKVKRENPETEVIMITGHGDMDLAIKSLKHKATDFITKPINVNALEVALQRARERILTRRKLKEYTEHLEALVKEKTELQSHLASLGLMIGSISHGIKGLLTGLDGGIYLMDAGFRKENDTQVREGLDIINSTVRKIRKMMMDILFCAKERKLNLKRVEVRQFFDGLVKELAPTMENQGIEFEKQCDPATETFRVDTAYLHSALFNIFENAVDACGRNRKGEAAKIEFRAAATPENVEFEIRDNGIGMDTATRKNIFSPFFSSKGSEGTGLGLFVARTIIQQHGGAIDVESSPGRGTVFRIKLPKRGPT